jgi:hypothetical protein
MALALRVLLLPHVPHVWAVPDEGEVPLLVLCCGARSARRPVDRAAAEEEEEEEEEEVVVPNLQNALNSCRR